jgi:hypothetical protein
VLDKRLQRDLDGSDDPLRLGAQAVCWNAGDLL